MTKRLYFGLAAYCAICAQQMTVTRPKLRNPVIDKVKQDTYLS